MRLLLIATVVWTFCFSGTHAADHALNAVDAAEDVVLNDSDAPVAVAAAWQAAVPSLIGADGPLLTQVEAAQRLGLSGKDTTVCVIDTGVDISHPNFGACSEGIRGRACRVKFGFDAESDSRDPSPRRTDTAEAGHGTHVAGIAVGGFPDKLLDAAGKPLPYQRGVAYEARLGALRAVNKDGAFPGEYMNRALHKTIRENCDVNNLSLGSFNVVPNPSYRQGMEETAAADILTTAAAGNDEGAITLGPRLFGTASPASYPKVFAVAHLQNAANPGSLVEISTPISTSSGLRNMLVAIQRADTQTSLASLCSPSCDSLPLPMNIHLVRMGAQQTAPAPPSLLAAALGSVTATATVQCGLKMIFEASEYKKGQALLLHFEPECKFYHTAPELWQYLRAMSPALVLMAMPSDNDAHAGALYYKNAQIPVLWMRSDDGRALAEQLAFRDARSMPPLQLKSLPGATLVPVPDEQAGQPAATSSMGPAFDLSIKPDIAAPGSLYSSLPNSTYQTWPGTSMSSPYMAGVLALWKQHMHNLEIEQPPGGWINAAFTAFKNTAKPIKYGNSSLVWPPAKVGAGMVQAFSGIVTNVTVTPAELLMKTDGTHQQFTLSVTNAGWSDASYTLGHQPAVTLLLTKSWYNQAFDAAAPTAVATGVERVVKVPARSTKVVKVGITIPPELKALDAIVSGYITLTPVGATPPSASRQPLSTSTPITLSIPYQGTSKDYSTVGTPNSLALFVPALPDLHALAAQLISDKPPLFVCDTAQRSGCAYSPDGVTIAADSPIPGFMFASTLLRPLADVKIQLWSSDWEVHLGTSASLGPAPASSPFRRTYLFEGSWDGSYLPVNSAAEVFVPMKTGEKYRVKLELWPVLAAGDKLAGRKQGQPMIFTVNELIVMLADPSKSASTIQVASIGRDGRGGRDGREGRRDRRDRRD
ncbi:hypothetical protein OEZ85_007645 [Tetradesmus obliquus]|uniref:Peptidase S8/S53 domain-containing protein n=1 Tax=Tetradesmus obliquus TaxID=3088 RepID=A0ABY8TIA6_TETOB|nr:hypothetical protein OEZ85_007645 [Tetradesmus obliquus]